jgi:hypothetical protein
MNKSDNKENELIVSVLIMGLEGLKYCMGFVDKDLHESLGYYKARMLEEYLTVIKQCASEQKWAEIKEIWENKENEEST